MRKNLAVLLLSLVTTIAWSQSPCASSFSGKTVSGNGEALVGATVMLSPVDVGQVADVTGHFHFEKLCPGDYKVTVRYVGYKDSVFVLTLRGHIDRIVALEEETKKLEEVIVQDKKLHAEHAQNYVTLNERDLAESAGKALGEALKDVPGVNSIQAGPGIFKPVIHGVHSQRVLILNHGIRQEGQQWGAEHAPEIDPFIASEVIVIKDAAAIKYGGDALGGVIVVNPPRLPESAGLGGSFNSIFQTNGRSGTVSGVLEGGLKRYKGWGWRLQGTGKRAGDFSTSSYLLANTGMKEFDFSAAAGYHGKNFGAEVFFSSFQTELGILKGTSTSSQADLVAALEREQPQYTTEEFTYSIGEPGQQVGHNLLKVNAHGQTDKGEWHMQYGFQQNARKEFDIRGLGVSSRVPALDLRLITHTVEAEWEMVTEGKRSLCFGANGMAQSNDNVPGTQRIPLIPNFVSLSGGPFMVAKFWVGKWTVDGGVRYDYRYYDVAGRDYKNTLYHSTLDFGNVSATLGTTLKLNKTDVISTSIGYAWRPPHVVELYSMGTHQSAAAKEYGLLLNDSTNEVMNINTSSFELEKAIKAVGTYRHSSTRLVFEATVYANFIFNYIFLRPSGITRDVRGAGLYFRYAQTDALFLGADLTSTIQVNAHWKLVPKATLLRASDYRNGDYLLFIPTNRAELTLRYDEGKRWGLNNIYLESTGKYVAKQFRAPRVISARDFEEAATVGSNPLGGSSANFDFMGAPQGYFLIGVAAGVSVPLNKTRLDFRVASENLVNATYREYTNRFRYFSDDLGRNFIFSVKYIF